MRSQGFQGFFLIFVDIAGIAFSKNVQKNVASLQFGGDQCTKTATFAATRPGDTFFDQATAQISFKKSF